MSRTLNELIVDHQKAKEEANETLVEMQRFAIELCNLLNRPDAYSILHSVEQRTNEVRFVFERSLGEFDTWGVDVPNDIINATDPLVALIRRQREENDLARVEVRQRLEARAVAAKEERRQRYEELKKEFGGEELPDPWSRDNG